MKTKNLASRWTVALTLTLTALLAVGPGAGITPAAEKISGDILVETSPNGAMVYLDGVARGPSPLQIDDVSEGDHRVTVLKDGFLENTQLLSVKAGKTESVKVELTASKNARYSTSVQSSSEKGGSKLPLILGIAGGGAVAAYLLLRDTNEPPTAGSITLTPASPGLLAVTNFTFSSQGASDPNDDTLTYSWDFGDGQSGSGQTTNHTYQSAGTFNVSLSVSDGEETATTSTSVQVGSLSGSWSGTIRNGFELPFGADLTQSGTNLSGTFRALGDTGSIAGSVSAPSSARFTVTIPGFAPFTLTGTIASDLNRIEGTVQGSGFTGEPFTMTR